MTRLLPANLSKAPASWSPATAAVAAVIGVASALACLILDVGAARTLLGAGLGLLTGLLVLRFVVPDLREPRTAAAPSFSALEEQREVERERRIRELADRFSSALASFETQRQHEDQLAEALNESVRERTSEMILANRRLERLDRQKDEFISLLAHELRTPLSSVRSYVELLQNYGDSIPAAERAEFLDIIRTQVQRLGRLIDELLDLNRLRSGRFQLHLAPCDAAAVMREVFDSLRAVARDSRHELELAEGGAPLARCDRDRLVQIVTNLVGNALKYTPAGCRVRLAAAVRDDGKAALSIEDDGPGVSAAEREMIFEPFYRAEHGGEPGVQGTGLGLYLSRELARQMGGDLLYEAAAGGGARFVLELPAGDAPAAPATGDDAPATATRG